MFWIAETGNHTNMVFTYFYLECENLVKMVRYHRRYGMRSFLNAFASWVPTFLDFTFAFPSDYRYIIFFPCSKVRFPALSRSKFCFKFLFFILNILQNSFKSQKSISNLQCSGVVEPKLRYSISVPVSFIYFGQSCGAAFHLTRLQLVKVTVTAHHIPGSICSKEKKSGKFFHIYLELVKIGPGIYFYVKRKH